MGATLAKRVGQRPIGFVGGVLALPGIQASVSAALPEGQVIFPKADAALAAGQMCTTAMTKWLATLRGNRGPA